MRVANVDHDPLMGGFYTVADAARLLHIDNRQRIYRWLRPANSNGPAVIARDYEPIARIQELSFWDLIEVRFVEHFRGQGLSLQYLRRVAETARQAFKTQHPFALSKAEFLTDRKKIFEQYAEGESRKVREMLTGQYELYETIETVLAKGVSFNPQTHLAEEWRPMELYCPRVVINPHFAYGQPVIGKKRVPTSAVFRQWRAEGGDQHRVAKWWGLKTDEVAEAIEFEVRLAA